MKITWDIANSVSTGAETRRQDKLVDAAEQFEGMLLQEILKPMQAGQDSWGGEEKSEDSASGTISSFGTEAVAKAIAKDGGLGIAKQVVRQVSQEHQKDAEKSPRGY